MTAPLRTAVVGAGHMGQLHARVYDEIPDSRLVAIVDVNAETAREVAERYNVAAHDSIAPILDQVDAVSIAVPTTMHLEAARPFIERGIACLIEKPIADGVERATRIVELARAHGCVVAVGHIERFNPVVAAMDRMEVKPKFIETHRISPFTFRSADIGVVLDMMIHDIDVVLHLTGSPVTRVDAVGVNVLGPHEDIANARLAFANGCVANLTASRLAVKTERTIRVFSQEAYLSLDYQRKSGIAVKKDANLDVLRLAREGKFNDITDLPFTKYADMLKIEPLQVGDEEPARREIEAFLEAVRTGGQTQGFVTAEQGLAAVQCADDIVGAIKQHQWDGTPTGRVGLDDDLIGPPDGTE